MVDAPLLTSGQRGGVRIALGAIAVVLGLLALIWPGVTLLVVAVLFGLELIAAGVVRVLAAVTLSELPGSWRAVSGILGALTIVAGIICLVRPGTSLFVLVVVIAVGWFLDGISELVSAFTVSRGAGERIGLVAFGVISIIAAIVLIAFPLGSLVLLAKIGGVILIAFGIASVIGVILGRRRQAPEPATTAPTS
ncbi:MAG TPA: DUF308 domain-containing protein [Propionibacteriaceae bacterium]|nr:DUF308 domain-containing protein [Propionibacteriaceae bacterium]